MPASGSPLANDNGIKLHVRSGKARSDGENRTTIKRNVDLCDSVMIITSNFRRKLLEL